MGTSGCEARPIAVYVLTYANTWNLFLFYSPINTMPPTSGSPYAETACMRNITITARISGSSSNPFTMILLVRVCHTIFTVKRMTGTRPFPGHRSTQIWCWFMLIHFIIQPSPGMLRTTHRPTPRTHYLNGMTSYTINASATKNDKKKIISLRSHTQSVNSN